MKIVRTIAYVLFLMGVMYLAASSMYYRFSHPELTETQLMLKLVDAFMWRE